MAVVDYLSQSLMAASFPLGEPKPLQPNLFRAVGPDQRQLEFPPSDN
jgi:hypothetical protein